MKSTRNRKSIIALRLFAPLLMVTLFGKSVLFSDIYLRTMGFRRVAKKEYAEAPGMVRKVLDAYAAGVNAYILERKPKQLAAEFAFLGLHGLSVKLSRGHRWTLSPGQRSWLRNSGMITPSN